MNGVQQTMIQKIKNDSISHTIVQKFHDNGIGAWIILSFAGIGFLTVFRKKIKAWLK